MHRYLNTQLILDHYSCIHCALQPQEKYMKIKSHTWSSYIVIKFCTNLNWRQTNSGTCRLQIKSILQQKWHCTCSTSQLWAEFHTRFSTHMENTFLFSFTGLVNAPFRWRLLTIIMHVHCHSDYMKLIQWGFHLNLVLVRIYQVWTLIVREPLQHG